MGTPLMPETLENPEQRSGKCSSLPSVISGVGHPRATITDLVSALGLDFVLFFTLIYLVDSALSRSSTTLRNKHIREKQKPQADALGGC